MSKTSYFNILVFFLSMFMFSSASAWTYNLVRDLGVKGVMRYCQYDNGKTYAINAAEICRISITDSAPGFGRGQGSLIGEYQDGMTKVCVYQVLGERKAIRKNSVSICPLSHKF